MRSILLAAVSALLFISCNGNTNQFLLEDYSIDREDVSISVMPVVSDYHFSDYPDHVFGALRPQEQRVFNRDLGRVLAEQTRANVTGIVEPSAQVNNEFERREFPLSDDSFDAITPKQGQPFETESGRTRFVLILDQYFFTPYSAEVGGDSYAGHESEIEERLRFETNYVIWDTDLKDAVAWGKVNTTEQINFNNTRSTYVKLLNKAVERIVAVSPFNGVNV